jgi:hypothetical protein
MESRAANQTKTEPFPASATEAEAETPGSRHPQAPSGTTDGGAGDVGDPASVPLPGRDESAPGSSEESPVVQGLHTPDVTEPDPRSTAG